MKVDQYRIRKDERYSFVVPAGMDLGEFEGDEKWCLEIYQPFVLEKQGVEIDTLATASELAIAMADLARCRMAVFMTIPIAEMNNTGDDGIG